jgi:hypothetical protein
MHNLKYAIAIEMVKSQADPNADDGHLNKCSSA